MKRFKILAVIAIVALAGCLVFACSSGSDSGGDGEASGSSAVNGFQGGKKGGGGGGGGTGKELTNEQDIKKALDPDGKGIAVYDEDGWKINKSVTIPSTGIRFNDSVTITDDVTIAIPSGANVIFEYGLKTEGDLTIDAPADATNAGDVIVNGDFEVGGDLTVTNGTVEVKKPDSSPPSAKASFSVEGDTTIGKKGELIVNEKVLFEPDGDVTIEGALVLNGDMVIPNGKTLTIVKGDSDGPNDDFKLKGKGTIDATDGGKIELKVSDSQVKDGQDKTNLVPMEAGAKMKLSADSSLKLTIGMMSGDTPYDLDYYVFSGTSSDKPDFLIEDGVITVEKVGGKLRYTIDSTYDSDGSIDSHGEVKVVGGFYPFMPTTGTAYVYSWADIVVLGDSTLTVGASGTSTTFVIEKGYTLETKEEVKSKGVVLTTAGTVVVGTNNTVVNLGTFTNNGFVDCDTGSIYKGFSDTPTAEVSVIWFNGNGEYENHTTGIPAKGVGAGASWTGITWSTAATARPTN